MTGSGKSGNNFPLEASTPTGTAPLESILCTEELHRRPSGPLNIPAVASRPAAPPCQNRPFAATP